MGCSKADSSILALFQAEIRGDDQQNLGKATEYYLMSSGLPDYLTISSHSLSFLFRFVSLLGVLLPLSSSTLHHCCRPSLKETVELHWIGIQYEILHNPDLVNRR